MSAASEWTAQHSLWSPTGRKRARGAPGLLLCTGHGMNSSMSPGTVSKRPPAHSGLLDGHGPLRRQLNGYLAVSRALKHLIHIARRAAVNRRYIRPIAHQHACLYRLSKRCDDGEPVLEGGLSGLMPFS